MVFNTKFKMSNIHFIRAQIGRKWKCRPRDIALRQNSSSPIWIWTEA